MDGLGSWCFLIYIYSSTSSSNDFQKDIVVRLLIS